MERGDAAVLTVTKFARLSFRNEGTVKATTPTSGKVNSYGCRSDGLIYRDDERRIGDSDGWHMDNDHFRSNPNVLSAILTASPLLANLHSGLIGLALGLAGHDPALAASPRRLPG